MRTRSSTTGWQESMLYTRTSKTNLSLPSVESLRITALFENKIWFDRFSVRENRV